MFNSNLKGLVVPNDKLDDFKKTFRLYSRRIRETEDGDYMLDHTTYMYLLDKKGKFVNILGSNLNHEELAEVIEEHILELE